MNTHESYVSLETAKLLKQAGFDWETIRSYGQDEGLYGTIGISRNFNAEKGFIAASSLAVAQRWLREVKGMHIEIIVGDNSKDWGYYYFTDIHEPDKMPLINGVPKMSVFYSDFDTYESALEAGINRCLTLLLKEE